jgi:chromosome partitioning protein
LPSLAFVSPKGGAGKTTAALIFALGVARQGQKAALIDSDINKPLMHWASLPEKPDGISVHPAPTSEDIAISLREARRLDPQWIILDTEGSARGAMAFRLLRPDLIITPLAASQIEVIQAIKAAELVREFGRKGDRTIPHFALLTRLPVTQKGDAVRQAVMRLRQNGIALLPAPLIENQVFRNLFEVGGDFDAPDAEQTLDLAAARNNADLYVTAVEEAVRTARGS